MKVSQYKGQITDVLVDILGIGRCRIESVNTLSVNCVDDKDHSV